ncbi:hypothetical protein [Nitrosopumilus sp.]|uniref:hypothetical protein n=1 Tax=Nitrosopumilus sp. TaxID=2024843 RepID=UPI0034A0733F
MPKTNTWSLQIYPLSDFKKEFNLLTKTSQNQIIQLLNELIVLTDPEDHNFSIDCPSIQGFNHAVKYILTSKLILLIALDRIDSGIHIERIITLYSCSE